MIILDLCKQTKSKYGLDSLICLGNSIKFKELGLGSVLPLAMLPILSCFPIIPILALFSHFSLFYPCFPIFPILGCIPYFSYFGVQCYIEWSVGTFCQLMDPEIGSCYITNTKLLLFYCTKKWEGLVIDS